VRSTKWKAPSEELAVGRVRGLSWRGVLGAGVRGGGWGCLVLWGRSGRVGSLRRRWRCTASARFRVVGGKERVLGPGGLQVSDEVPEGSGLVEVSD